MWGAVWRAVQTLPIGYLFALVVEEFMAQLLPIMRAAPDSEGSALIAAAEAVEANFLLLVILGTIISLLGRAHLESRLGGAT